MHGRSKQKATGSSLLDNHFDRMGNPLQSMTVHGACCTPDLVAKTAQGVEASRVKGLLLLQMIERLLQCSDIVIDLCQKESEDLVEKLLIVLGTARRRISPDWRAMGGGDCHLPLFHSLETP